MIEYVRGGLELTPPGRRLLRRAGTEGSAGRPDRVTDLLQQLDEKDLAEQGSVPAPATVEVAAALEELTASVTRGLERAQASNEARLVGPAMLPIWHLASGPLYQVLPDVEGEEGEEEADAPAGEAAADAPAAEHSADARQPPVDDRELL